jgi:Ca2+-transporting ATPase
MMHGLSSSEAEKQLKTFGYNQLPASKPKNNWKLILDVMQEPMFLLLIGCSVLYIILGDYREGIILFSSISLIIFITFYQHRKTEKALESLRKLSSPKASVMRDGVAVDVPSREVVPGDIMVLREGDRVAADAKVLETINLTVDESMLTGESIAVAKELFTNEGESKGEIYSGTLVVQGTGYAEVFATGLKTQFGQIGISLENIEQKETRLQKEMKILIRNLFLIGAFLCVTVVIAFYLTRGNFIFALLNGLAATMAILPEEFPVILTVFLALGAWRLSKKNVLTRKPSAIETLGSATVLCSDKTGTITQNKMEIASLYDGKEIFSRNQFSNNKSNLKEILTVAHLACYEDSVDPMEKAIETLFLELTEKESSNIKLIKEYALSKELLAMTRVHEDSSTNQMYISAKGAPEAIFKLCNLNESEQAKHLDIVQKFANTGNRVIAVASAQKTAASLPDSQTDFKFDFLGIIALEDPIRPEVPQAIKECAEAGVRVMLITGDYPATLASIAKQIGLNIDGEILTGEDLKAMNDAELKERIKSTTLFARVIPEQKLRIVNALKSNNEIVAMTGDGVNDAPALKAAHIGIAMGKKGTDVAREASSLVIIDDNFASIVAAIHSGRRIFDNLQKAMSYVLAIHIPIIGLVLLPTFLQTIPILLMPLHIIFMELIIDPICSIAFESEQDEKNIMSRPPRGIEEKFFGSRKILQSIIEGSLLLLMVTGVFFFSIHEGHTEGEVRAIAFSALIIGNIVFIINKLSKTRNFISILFEKNPAVIWIGSIALIILFLIITLKPLQAIFSFDFPGYSHFIPAFVGAFIMLVILETYKYITNKISR